MHCKDTCARDGMCEWAEHKGWCEAANFTVTVVPDSTSGEPVESGPRCNPALHMKGATGLERKTATAPSCVSLVHQPTFIVDFGGKRDYFMLGNFLPTMRSLLLESPTRTLSLSLALTLALALRLNLEFNPNQLLLQECRKLR